MINREIQLIGTVISIVPYYNEYSIKLAVNRYETLITSRNTLYNIIVSDPIDIGSDISCFCFRHNLNFYMMSSYKIIKKNNQKICDPIVQWTIDIFKNYPPPLMLIKNMYYFCFDNNYMEFLPIYFFKLYALYDYNSPNLYSVDGRGNKKSRIILTPYNPGLFYIQKYGDFDKHDIFYLNFNKPIQINDFNKMIALHEMSHVIFYEQNDDKGLELGINEGFAEALSVFISVHNELDMNTILFVLFKRLHRYTEFNYYIGLTVYHAFKVAYRTRHKNLSLSDMIDLSKKIAKKYALNSMERDDLRNLISKEEKRQSFKNQDIYQIKNRLDNLILKNNGKVKKYLQAFLNILPYLEKHNDERCSLEYLEDKISLIPTEDRIFYLFYLKKKSEIESFLYKKKHKYLYKIKKKYKYYNKKIKYYDNLMSTDISKKTDLLRDQIFTLYISE